MSYAQYRFWCKYCPNNQIPLLTRREWERNGCPDAEAYILEGLSKKDGR